MPIISSPPGYRPGGTDVAIADGGTGASTAAGARTNLGAAASGVNTDITDLNSGIIGMSGQSRASAYRATSNQTISASTYTKVQLNAEDYDSQSEFDSTTNYRFTATNAGYYLIIGQIRWSNTLTGYAVETTIRKNGSGIFANQQHIGASYDFSSTALGIYYLAAGDYLELFAWHNAAASKDIILGSGYTFMQVHKLS